MASAKKPAGSAVWIETEVDGKGGFIAWITSANARHGFGTGKTREDAVADVQRALSRPLKVRHMDLIRAR